jgi:hypothetical protein
VRALVLRREVLRPCDGLALARAVLTTVPWYRRWLFLFTAPKGFSPLDYPPAERP